MDHFVLDTQATSFSIALLVKDSVFGEQRKIENYYIQPLEDRGLSRKDMVVVKLPYPAGKNPTAKAMTEYLNTIIPTLAQGGVTTLFCCDANYFKALTKVKKADACFGYVESCQIPNGEAMKVVLGLNYHALLRNPTLENRLWMGLDTLADWIKGHYQPVGENIINTGLYPQNEEAIAAFLDSLHQYSLLTVDIETFGLRLEHGGIGSISFAWTRHDGGAFACDAKATKEGCEFKKNRKVRELLRQFFTAYPGEMVFHNAPFDLKHLIYNLWMNDPLDTHGLLAGLDVMTRHFHDTKLIAYLCLNSTNRPELGLKTLSHEFAGNYAVDVKDITQVQLTDLLEYNLIDTLSTRYVWDKYRPILEEEQQEEIYETLFLPSLKPIIQMELTGMPVDVYEVSAVARQIEEAIEAETQRIQSNPYVQLAVDTLRQAACDKDNEGRKAKAVNPDRIKIKPLSDFDHVEFNPNSSHHLVTLLYDVMELPVLDTTQTGAPAVGKKTLEKLTDLVSQPEQREVLDALMGYSAASKIDSAFIPAFRSAWVKDDGMGYLHGSFNMGGTVSGRMSSSEPNMTNLPSGSQYGKWIKRCVKAPKGKVFVGADFASLEDRINALVTKDPNKLKVYSDGFDGHSLRTVNYWPEKFPDVDFDNPEQVNAIKKTADGDALRSRSKGPTFALTYAGTAYTLVKNAGFSLEEAQRIVENYMRLYATSEDWAAALRQEVNQTGFGVGAFGLKIRANILGRTVLDTQKTPYEAEKEYKTLRNALGGQSYGLLTNRAMNAVMDRVWASEHREHIQPVAMIHDALYFLVEANTAPLKYLNDILIEEMRWQDLPEIRHDVVKLGAELDVFYPSWAEALTLPNEIDEGTVYQLFSDHLRASHDHQSAA